VHLKFQLAAASAFKRHAPLVPLAWEQAPDLYAGPTKTVVLEHVRVHDFKLESSVCAFHGESELVVAVPDRVQVVVNCWSPVLGAPDLRHNIRI